jgi:hypothetical protein
MAILSSSEFACCIDSRTCSLNGHSHSSGDSLLWVVKCRSPSETITPQRPVLLARAADSGYSKQFRAFESN